MFNINNASKFGILVAASGLTISLSNAQIATSNGTVTSEILQGIRTTKMATVNGTVSVITPALIEVGDRISGTVLLEPKGDTEASRNKNLSAMQGLAICVLGSNILPNKPAFIVKVPNKPTNITIEGTYTPVPVLPQATIPSGGKTRWPSTSTSKAPLIITGNFDGDLSNTKCSVGGQPAIVLTETPSQAIVLLSPNLSGPQTVIVSEGEVSTVGSINVISFKLSVGKSQLLKGEQTTLEGLVTGLQGLNADQFPIRTSLSNESPTSITFKSGNCVFKDIRKSDVNKLGEFRTKASISALAAGSFTVSGQVIVRGIVYPCPPPVHVPSDPDKPLDMNLFDTVGSLEHVSPRILLDTLKDLRYRKCWDYVGDKLYQAWLGEKIRLVKAALKSKGIDVDDKAIDDPDF